MTYFFLYQYLFLYHDIELAKNYVKAHNLPEHLCHGMNNPHEFLEEGADLSPLLNSLRNSERIILPDFHENPNAKDIIRVVLKCMYKDNMNRDKLWEYAHRHFPETRHWYFAPDGNLMDMP